MPDFMWDGTILDAGAPLSQPDKLPNAGNSSRKPNIESGLGRAMWKQLKAGVEKPVPEGKEAGKEDARNGAARSTLLHLRCPPSIRIYTFVRNPTGSGRKEDLALKTCYPASVTV
jgi:hypothetical protein